PRRTSRSPPASARRLPSPLAAQHARRDDRGAASGRVTRAGHEAPAAARAPEQRGEGAVAGDSGTRGDGTVTSASPPETSLGALDDGTRRLVRLSAVICAGSEADIRDAMSDAADGLPPEWVEEV